MRIAIAGIYTESSTFSLDRALESYFVQMRGDELVDSYEWPDRLGSLVDDVEWVPILRAMTGAAGPVDPAAYDAFEAEIVAGLAAAGPLDGLYLDMHGAMSVAGRDGAEERFLKAVRDVVGPGPFISLSMDPHGNFSRELAGYVDLATCHRHAPHIDTWQTRERAVTLLLQTIRDGRKPLKAWARIPVLFPGERTSTVVEPGATVFGSVIPAIARHGALDAGLWIGFAWADEPHCSAAVMVTGFDEAAITACAAEIAQTYWDARGDFSIVTDHYGSWSEGLDYVLGGAARPCFLSDSGDNVTAGGSGDLTYALTETLAREDVLASGKTFLFAGLVDRDSLAAAVEAGVGQSVQLAIGAQVDSRFAGPVDREWVVEKVIEGLFGEGIVGAVIRSGTISVSLQSHRTVFAKTTDPAFLKRRMPGLAWTETAGFDAVVVKNGYLFPGQVADSASAFMALTPGGTDLDFDRLVFERLDFPVYPLDRDFEADLTPELLPVNGTVLA